ncbi:velvet factor-domain-containing protein [Syncephalastrum racemosum]|uniref:Velvet factor-domain-containing protein n=1 Tax=Syncephalastrum racemosum TaxID=13706 RepID=A0A1X2HS38_SYNRA|nr:velvet factor-domain-containing protein [Syncephalastrum racemosum]
MAESRDRVFHHVPSQPYSSSSSSSFSSIPAPATVAICSNTASVTSELQLADNLTGPSYSSGATFKNLEGEPAIYFAFPDLSIRVTSQYRLLFSVVDLGRSEVVAEVLSEPFTAYHAKTFPGMQETSPLARHLADQGLRLPVRNNLRRKKS